MDHKFEPSKLSFVKCAHCGYPPIAHTDQATCEACPNVGNMELYVGMLLCADCISKEIEHQSPIKQAERLQVERMRAAEVIASKPVLSLAGVIDRARQIDQTVQIRTDVFNAETVSIQEIKDAVNADDSIPSDQKHFRVAFLLRERQEHFQKVIFDAQNTVVESQNKQRVIQQELNTLANRLRQEERDKLSLNSPDYQPGKVKTAAVPKVKSLGTQKPKFDKKELIDLAAAMQDQGYPVQWSTLQTIAVQKNMTAKQAAEHAKKTFDSFKPAQ